MLSVLDDLEVKMAAGGGSGGAHLGDDLAHPNLIALFDGDALQVVVCGDQAVAVVDLHPVATAPGVPSGGPDHSGVGCVDTGAAGGCVVLAPVEFS
jgi:hypothetical protein